MLLIAIGRLRSGPEAELFARYAARLRPALAVSEIAEGRRAGDTMLAAIPPDALAVALDPRGAAKTSEAFASLLQGWREAARTPCFLIGGADGLDTRVQARADATLSLGPLTWPHLLARVMLAEQLYRAQCILTGHPYHHGAKPR